MANFHLGTLQEAKKETNLIHCLRKKKNAATHELRWEHLLPMEPACPRIFIQPHDVMQDSKEDQNAKR